MSDELAKAIEGILKVHDRWPEGAIIYKRAIDPHVGVLRKWLGEWKLSHDYALDLTEAGKEAAKRGNK